MTSKQTLFTVRLSLCFVPLLLVACSSGTSSTSGPVDSITKFPAPVVALGSDEVLSRIKPMPSQQIPSGECGLFLWAKRQDAPLIFFQRSGGDTLMHLDGNVVELSRASATDQIAMQFYQKQTFSVADLIVKIDVKPEQIRSLQQGLKIPSGSISITTKSGWSAAMPVAGAIGCP